MVLNMAIALVETGFDCVLVMAPVVVDRAVEVVLNIAIALVETLADAVSVPAEVSRAELPVDRPLSDVLPPIGGGAKEYAGAEVDSIELVRELAPAIPDSDGIMLPETDEDSVAEERVPDGLELARVLNPAIPDSEGVMLVDADGDSKVAEGIVPDELVNGPGEPVAEVPVSDPLVVIPDVAGPGAGADEEASDSVLSEEPGPLTVAEG